MPEQREFTRRSDRIEELVRRLEETGDPATRAVAQELLQAVIELHAAALDRMLDTVAQSTSGEQTLARFAEDTLVSNVLSLHGIHPIALKDRIATAIDDARPYLAAHGGDVELASVGEDGTVHVRLSGTCGNCASSTETLRSHVESTIVNAAPEVVAVVAEPLHPAASSGLVILQTN